MEEVNDYLAQKKLEAAEQMFKLTFATLKKGADLIKGILEWLKGNDADKGRSAVKAKPTKLEKIDVSDEKEAMKAFGAAAKKHGISYTIVKNDRNRPNECSVYFKAKDAKALEACFKDYAKAVMQAKGEQAQAKPEKPRLKQLRAKIKSQMPEAKENVKQAKRGVVER